MGMESLEQKIADLKKICHEIDPHAPISPGLQKKLAHYHITDWDDPFTLTNRLLVLLEESIEKLELEKRQ